MFLHRKSDAAFRQCRANKTTIDHFDLSKSTEQRCMNRRAGLVFLQREATTTSWLM